MKKGCIQDESRGPVAGHVVSFIKAYISLNGCGLSIYLGAHIADGRPDGRTSPPEPWYKYFHRIRSRPWDEVIDMHTHWLSGR